MDPKPRLSERIRESLGHQELREKPYEERRQLVTNLLADAMMDLVTRENEEDLKGGRTCTENR